MAHNHLRGERAGHTLQTTALVHETYLRFADAGQMDCQNRAHFLGVAARLMRQILVDYAYPAKSEAVNGMRFRLTKV